MVTEWTPPRRNSYRAVREMVKFPRYQIDPYYTNLLGTCSAVKNRWYFDIPRKRMT